METVMVTQTPTQTPSVKYDMAYPGILPDSPLYKLKLLREKIILFFITDPQKKIDYYLLQSDKGILASAMLADKKEYSLAETTALKAENNYTLLSGTLPQLLKKPDDAYFAKLKAAALKHQEILLSIVKKVPQSEQKTFLQVIDFSRRNWQTIEKYEQENGAIQPAQ